MQWERYGQARFHGGRLVVSAHASRRPLFIDRGATHTFGRDPAGFAGTYGNAFATAPGAAQSGRRSSRRKREQGDDHLALRRGIADAQRTHGNPIETTPRPRERASSSPETRQLKTATSPRSWDADFPAKRWPRPSRRLRDAPARSEEARAVPAGGSGDLVGLERKHGRLPLGPLAPTCVFTPAVASTRRSLTRVRER